MAAAAIALLVSGSDVAFGDPSDTLLTAMIYRPGAQPTTESVTAGSLESQAGQCPVYGRSTMDEYDRQGIKSSWGLPSHTWSLATILGCLQPAVQASDVTGGVTVFNAGSPEAGLGSTLTTQDLTSPSDFSDPTENPVVSDLGTSRQFNRPWRGGNDEDQLDQVTETGGPIVISVFEGHPIQVNASASPTTVSQGDTVSFSASASGSGLSYQWDFGGGAPSSTQQNPEVTFTSAGVWTVSLLATDANGDAGHAQLTETVNASGSTTPTTPTTPGTVITGPTNGSGTTPSGGQGPPTRGSGKPTHKPTHQPTSTRSSPSKGTNKKHKKTTQTSTTQTSTTPSAGSGSGSGGSGGSGSGSNAAGTPTSATTPTSTATTPRKPAAPRTTPHPAPPAAGAPRVVTGELISDVVSLPESASPLVHAVAASATPATAPALHPPSGTAVLPIIASALAVLALLGAGAGRELRGSGLGRRLRLLLHARA
ncbi:MAG: PKD domain-containing protein [Solirubrobacteraceae bacterium]